jgi:hypothetical protein
MEVGQGPNWGCSSKGKKKMLATIQSRTFLSSRLLSKNIKIRIYKTIVLFILIFMILDSRGEDKRFWTEW